MSTHFSPKVGAELALDELGLLAVNLFSAETLSSCRGDPTIESFWWLLHNGDSAAVMSHDVTICVFQWS